MKFKSARQLYKATDLDLIRFVDDAEEGSKRRGVPSDLRACREMQQYLDLLYVLKQELRNRRMSTQVIRLNETIGLIERTIDFF